MRFFTSTLKLLCFLLFTASTAFGSGNDFIPPNIIIASCAMTGTATCTSSVVDIRGFNTIGIQGNYTGTASGTFYVDVSQDYNANTGNTGTWNTLPASPTPPSGSSGSSFFDITVTSAAYIRVRYVNTSGSGTLTTYLGAKAL